MGGGGVTWVAPPFPILFMNTTLENNPDEARKLWHWAESTLNEEKDQYSKRGIKIGKSLREQGSLRIDGVGQKIAEIPLGLYIRWQQEFPGCWQDKGFVDAFLKDNPQFKAITRSDTRNSIIV